MDGLGMRLLFVVVLFKQRVYKGIYLSCHSSAQSVILDRCLYHCGNYYRAIAITCSPFLWNTCNRFVSVLSEGA